MLIWILLLIIGCVFVFGLYYYFLGYMFLCLIKEFFIFFGIVIVCVLFINVIMKIFINLNKLIIILEIYGNGKECNFGIFYLGIMY